MSELVLEPVSMMPDMFLSKPAEKPSKHLEVSQKDREKLRESLSDTWEAALEDLSLPDWCDRSKLKSDLTEKSLRAFLTSDFMLALARINQQSSDETRRFVNEVLALKDATQVSISFIDKSLKETPKSEIASDLPWSVFSTFYLYSVTIRALSERINAVCSQYSKKVPVGTRPQILERYYVKPFKGIVERLFGLSKEASKDSTRLRLYLSIWNSENYADVFTEKPYLLSNLDEKYLNRLYESYEQHLYEFRDGLYKEAPDLFNRNTEASDSTVAMLKDLIDLI